MMAEVIDCYQIKICRREPCTFSTDLHSLAKLTLLKFECAKTASLSPVAVFQTCAVLSQDADIICKPSGEKAAEWTLAECPFSSASHSPVAVFQIHAVLSQDADTICISSEEKTAELTASECPFSSALYSPVAEFQICSLI